MADDYVERVIAQMPRINGEASAMPRWFGAKREASISLLRKFYPTAPPPTVHHYTSSASLISRIANNEFWLSDATFLNDRYEIELGRRLACDRVKAKIAKYDSPEVQTVLRLALDKFERETDPQVYVACFSFEGDDLTQWRAYGCAEAPVAIELEHSPLMFGYTSEGFFDRVQYDENDQIWIFDRLSAAYAVAYLEDVRNPIPNERRETPLARDQENKIVADSLYYALWQHIVTCKDPAFVAEREVRFVYTANDFSQNALSWHPEHPHPRFRESAGRVISLPLLKRTRISEYE